MKSLISVTLAIALLLPACATVEIATGDEAKIEQTVQTAERVELRKLARFMTSKFVKNNWSPSLFAQKKQSAVSILMGGMKSEDAPRQSHIETYIESVSSKQDIITDISEAHQIVEQTRAQALTFLAENPDVQDVKADLKALEKALIVSIKSEETFKSALEAKLIKTADQELESYSASIDDLRAVTDAYGERQRGQQSVSQTG